MISNVARATILLAVVLAAARVTPSHSQGANGAYSVGYVGDFSGPMAAFGKNLRTGFTAYVDNINAHGGINGKKLAVDYVDDGTQADRSAAAFTSLARDQGGLRP